MLRRWQASRSSLGSFISEALGFGRQSWSLTDPSITLGPIKGRYGRRSVALLQLRDQIVVQVDRQQEPLTRLLHWQGAEISVCDSLLRRLANRKGSKPSAPAEPRQQWLLRKSERDQEILRRASKLRDQGLNWTQIAERIALMPFIKSSDASPIDPSTVRRILSKLRAR
jgi:hypothetical protein